MSIRPAAHELLRLMEIWCDTGKGDFSLTQKLHVATRDLRDAFNSSDQQPVSVSLEDIFNKVILSGLYHNEFFDQAEEYYKKVISTVLNEAGVKYVE